MGAEYLGVVFTVAFTAVTSLPLGRYIARIFRGQRTPLDPLLLPLERMVLRVARVDPAEEQGWQQ